MARVALLSAGHDRRAPAERTPRPAGGVSLGSATTASGSPQTAARRRRCSARGEAAMAARAPPWAVRSRRVLRAHIGGASERMDRE